ncbi:MAG: LON peptidase substrate-binding domain-containing protein [Acidobacteria bacterium]|nr:LON peptidase substrate-binding domain-containing protein [Acidobacteriota bacterium]
MIVPLFPLPNAVLFPKTPMPLFIFEDRYRTMVREAIAGSGELVIALMREGLEFRQAGISAVHSVACLGKIENYEELDDGKYNIVVVGLRRVRLIKIVEHSPYRMVEVEMIEDFASPGDSREIVRRQRRLGRLFSEFTELAAAAEPAVMDLMPQLDFEALVNMVVMTLNLPIEQKQALLEIDAPSLRCDMLIPILEQQLETLVIVRRYEHIKPENPGLN